MIAAEDILRARILIVDDQEANVRLLQRMLQEAGYSAVTVTSQPRDVAGLQQQHDHDLILLDLQMPSMDGFQVMESLGRAAAGNYLPVIVLTASPKHKLRALLAGAKDFISKPFDLLDVKTRIHNMLEVRLLYRQLQQHNRQLEQAVQERTAELRVSEARYRGLAALASDWYWEQNQTGSFTHVSGPVGEMLGMGFSGFLGHGVAGPSMGWVDAERAALHALIEARKPFLDFAFCRINADGSRRQFRVSGEPMFDEACAYIGYRGVGVEMHEPLAQTARPPRAHQAPAGSNGAMAGSSLTAQA